ncbi:MAG TPA: hypothetical protein VFX02_05440 [Gammaproteobacteria bacterium]|nr:hypothetical protein [Gammaproteobacteria bacterium]
MLKPSVFRTPTIHKLFMLTGVLAAAATLYLAWILLQRIEPQLTGVLRQQILAEFDLESFHQQRHALEAEERAAGGEYSPQQLEILQSDMLALESQTREAVEKLEQIGRQRAGLYGNIKLTLLAILLVLSASLMLAIFGFIGWRFRIRIVEEP